MKKGFPFALLALASLIGIQIPATAHSDSVHQTIQTESAQSLKHELATALAKQDQKQISQLQQKLTALLALPPQFLSEQIQISENILVRIFKTDKNLTPKFIDYLYFEPMETQDPALINEMKKNILVSFLANEQAKIYIRNTSNADQFVQALKERGATDNQLILIEQNPKDIFTQIIAQMRQDFPNQTQFPITENRVSLIVPSSIIKPRLALANTIFDRQFKGVEVDDFSYLDEPRENLQHNNEAIRYQTFQAMLDGLN